MTYTTSTNPNWKRVKVTVPIIQRFRNLLNSNKNRWTINAHTALSGSGTIVYMPYGPLNTTAANNQFWIIQGTSSLNSI